MRSDPLLWSVKYGNEPQNRSIDNSMGSRWSQWRVLLAALSIYSLLLITTDLFDPFQPRQNNFKLSKLPLRTMEDVQVAEYEQRRSRVKEVCKGWGAYTSRAKFLKSAQKPVEGDGLKNEVLKDRKDLSQSQLERLWQLNKKSSFHQMFVDQQHGLTWCKVPKAASTSWLYAFLQVAGLEEKTYKDKVGRHSLLRENYPHLLGPVLKTILPTTLKFMVVRHPFERVLSAYRDKLEDYERDLKARGGYYYSIYGKRIVRVYRRGEDSRREPTFREFVQYLLDTDVEEYDEHWRPVSLLCTPCHIRFDVIAKMETLERDADFILYHRGLAGVTHIEWSHRTSPTDHTTSDLASSYFSQLTLSEIQRLYQKYLMDFLMFEYEVEPYLKLVSGTAANNASLMADEQDEEEYDYDEEEEDGDNGDEDYEDNEEVEVTQDDNAGMDEAFENQYENQAAEETSPVIRET